jgi:hypothetical protein
VAGWNTSAAEVPNVKNEFAHCWVLRRHLCGCFFGPLLVLLFLTRALVFVVAVWVLGCGCVLSVA